MKIFVEILITVCAMLIGIGIGFLLFPKDDN